MNQFVDPKQKASSETDMNDIEHSQKSSFSDRPETLPAKSSDDYKSICKTAILSLVFAIMASAIAFMMIVVVELAVFVALIAFFGIGFGIVATISLNRYPEELTGQMPARIGLVLSIVLGLGAAGFYGYVYATEVPDGHVRINFNKLKPDPRKNEVIPPEAAEYDGKKVFIKGFVRPSDRKIGLKKFLLVGDFGSCCFGGNPEITDVIAIDLQDDLTVDYNLRVRRIAGTFRLNKSGKRVNEEGVPQVYYTIEADYIK